MSQPAVVSHHHSRTVEYPGCFLNLWQFSSVGAVNPILARNHWQKDRDDENSQDEAEIEDALNLRDELCSASQQKMSYRSPANVTTHKTTHFCLFAQWQFLQRQ